MSSFPIHGLKIGLVRLDAELAEVQIRHTDKPGIYAFSIADYTGHLKAPNEDWNCVLISEKQLISFMDRASEVLEKCVEPLPYMP